MEGGMWAMDGFKSPRLTGNAGRLTGRQATHGLQVQKGATFKAFDRKSCSENRSLCWSCGPRLGRGAEGWRGTRG